MKKTVKKSVKKSAKPRKPKLSGFQRRKLRREQMVVTPQEGEELRRIRVGQLETVNQWRREIAKVYREMRFNTIRTEIGTRLVYVAEIGARLAKMQEELESLEDLRRQLEQLQNGGLISQNAVEYLPASHDALPNGDT
jgi:hypothetical protein